MTKNKVYAVRKGFLVGIFDSWEECKKSVDGYSGAEFKSFASRHEAELYLGFHQENHNPPNDSSIVQAYVDGSYDNATLRYSFGCVILLPNGNVEELMGIDNDPELRKSRNIAGELSGAMFAIEWAAKRGYKKIVIYHDYFGISKWISGEWKAKSAVAKKYLDFVRSQKDTIEVLFEKVVAHSGNLYNERADRLARTALRREGSNWYNE